ncbi:MAG TPA: hypothetical protein VJN89_17865, partial [Candidatus Acidoferrum sp.]|nr:hypothetical protein [Candidatus Acidoferrum sp.]
DWVLLLARIRRNRQWPPSNRFIERAPEHCATDSLAARMRASDKTLTSERSRFAADASRAMLHTSCRKVALLAAIFTFLDFL